MGCEQFRIMGSAIWKIVSIQRTGMKLLSIYPVHSSQSYSTYYSSYHLMAFSHSLSLHDYQNGHCNVPKVSHWSPSFRFHFMNNNFIFYYNHQFIIQSHPGIGNWVSEQRKHQGKGMLSEERKELLEEIGFQWSIRKSFWDLHYEKLKKYKEEVWSCYRYILVTLLNHSTYSSYHLMILFHSLHHYQNGDCNVPKVSHLSPFSFSCYEQFQCDCNHQFMHHRVALALANG